MRVTAGSELATPGQIASQRAEAVIQQQHMAIGGQPLRMQMSQQVFVRCIKRLQRLVRLLRLAQQIELGECAGEKCHAAGHPVYGPAVCRVQTARSSALRFAKLRTLITAARANGRLQDAIAVGEQGYQDR